MEGVLPLSRGAVFDQIGAFLAANKEGILAVVGTTASGKTGLAIDIAMQFGGEIIISDSRQMYASARTLTAAPTDAELAQVLHHGALMLPPERHFQAKEYQDFAYSAIEKLQEKGRQVVLCGGTMLWVDAVLLGYSFDEAVPNAPRWPQLIVAPWWPRSVLYERINDRTQLMYEQGALAEAIELAKNYPHMAHNMETCVGVPQARLVLAGEMTEAEWIAAVAQATRNYAKRQLTWWRGREEVIWLDAESGV